MFLFFLKPKRRKFHRSTVDAINASSIYAPFLWAKAVSLIAWFLCLPFLIFAYSETIEPFIIFTFIGVITDFLEKLTNPDYVYF